MPKPACVKCRCFYRPKTNGVRVIEAMPRPFEGESTIRPNEKIAGRRQPAVWQPYKLWVADLWECPDCGHELITGWAQKPMMERHEPDFNLTCLREHPVVQINDC